MAERERGRVARHESEAPARALALLAPIAGRQRVGLFFVAGLTAAATIVGFSYPLFAPHSPTPMAAPLPTSSAVMPEALLSPKRGGHVGTATCAQCHPSQVKAWSASHHQLAMQEANASTVLGDFDNAKLEYNGVEAVFFKRDRKYFVRADGPDGKLADYEISYTFGVAPLQQYLIAFPGGRYQALSIAWDTRPKAEGGQRWFHLYPNEKVDHTDLRHWTGLYQNWNLQCAECHSTNLHKGYDVAANAYRTTYGDINVACEACHGPGSRHVDWAQLVKPPYAPTADKGLAVRLHSRWNEAWRFARSDAKFAERGEPTPAALMNVCASCHARRSTIAEGGLPGAPLEDTHRPALITPPLYYPDGQQREEVYVWGSFRQSKMFQHGVTCVDCHEPHALKLRADGNALCGNCHNPAVFDTDKHHFHKVGTKGAQCVECHMPSQNYMVVQARRDHSIRVPRPDLSSSMGSPNACTGCHAGRNPEWAAEAMDRWYGRTWRDRQNDGTILHAGDTQGAKGLPGLIDLARDASRPGIARATAATLAQPHMRADSLRVVPALLADPDPMVRVAALGMVEAAAPAARLALAAPLLRDAVRGVRIEAARILADLPDDRFHGEAGRDREQALQEYVGSLQLNADWPDANVNLGNLYVRQGRFPEARAAFERAVSLDPHFVGAYANQADLYRRQSREEDAEGVLHRGLALLPGAAELHHALGLLLVRKGDRAAAINELGEAAKLAPDNPRYAYVYAIGLHGAGRRGDALVVLREADARHSYNLEILAALISINRELGDAKAALVYARKVAEILPDDAGVKRLVDELAGAK